MTDTPTGPLSPEAVELLGQAPDPTPATEASADEAVRELQGKLDAVVGSEQHDPDAAPEPKPLHHKAQAAIKAAYEQLKETHNRARVQAESLGYSIDDEGNWSSTIEDPATTVPEAPAGVPFPPQLPVNYVPPPSAPQQVPRLVGLATRIAEATGGDVGEIAQELQGAFFETVAPIAQRILGPLTQSAVQMNKSRLAQADPDFPIYEKSWEYWNNEVGGAFSGDPLAAELARRLAVADHIDEISDRRATRKNARIVGRFTEAAAPSAQEGVTPQLPPGVDVFAREMGVSPKGLENLARKRAERLRREGYRDE